MKGGAGLVGPERFVRSAIFLDELVVEDCVEIRQLIDRVIFFFTEGLIFPDYVAVIQVRQDSAKASSVRKPCRRYDLFSGQAGAPAAECLDNLHIILAILKQGGVQVVELSVQFAFPFEEHFVHILREIFPFSKRLR